MQITLTALCRAKFAWLDDSGREMVYLMVTQLQADKAALLEFVRAAGEGILMTGPGEAPAPPAVAATASPAAGLPHSEAATPAGAGQPSGSQPAVVAASSPAPVPAQQQAATATGAVAEAETAAAAYSGLLPLEDASSFNFDLLLGGSSEVLPCTATPDMLPPMP